MWQFELSFGFGLVSAPLMWMAGSSMYLYLQDQAKEECFKILKMFSLGIKIMVVYVAAAHSVCCIALLIKKIIKVPKIMMLFNPVCIYIVAGIIGWLVQLLTKNAQLAQIFAGGASFGYGLMFLGCYISLINANKTEKGDSLF